jgi:LTXXQ motif family protein
MSKFVAAGLTALFVGTSSLAYAQAPAAAPAAASAGASAEQLMTAAEARALTDRRIEIVKAALQLTPDQAKLWPPVEEAIRTNAMARHERIEAMATRARSGGQFDPIQFMRNRSDNLAARAAGLKRLADAWQPLIQTLSPDQKERMRVLAATVLGEVRGAVESRRMQMEDEEED